MRQVINGEVSHRRNTLLGWVTKHILPHKSELVHETDTNRFKLGDGLHYMEDPDLPYFIDEPTIDAKIDAAIENSNPTGTDVDALIQAHVDSETPHPVYDDGPSFVLLYENAKV